MISLSTQITPNTAVTITLVVASNFVLTPFALTLLISILSIGFNSWRIRAKYSRLTKLTVNENWIAEIIDCVFKFNGNIYVV